MRLNFQGVDCGSDINDDGSVMTDEQFQIVYENAVFNKLKQVGFDKVAWFNPEHKLHVIFSASSCE